MNLIDTFKRCIAAGLGALLVTSAAFAADQGTPAEAEAMVKKAEALIKSKGPAAYEEISTSKDFKDRDLYVVVFDLNGKNLAHGTNPKLIGKDLMAIKDVDGKPFIKMITDIAKEKGKGWSDEFKFMNPATHNIEPKTMYVERLGDILVGCGVHKS
jgi:signal transduction histidine kinase